MRRATWHERPSDDSLLCIEAILFVNLGELFVNLGKLFVNLGELFVNLGELFVIRRRRHRRAYG